MRITEEVKGLPIYEYECTCCSSRFELKQSFSENGPAPCPRCGCTAERIFSPVPIIFKGSGFYTTDSRGSHSHSKPADGSDEAKGGGTDEAKPSSTDEAKPGNTEKDS